jgi:hypothetical protein
MFILAVLPDIRRHAAVPIAADLVGEPVRLFLCMFRLLSAERRASGAPRTGCGESHEMGGHGGGGETLALRSGEHPRNNSTFL